MAFLSLFAVGLVGTFAWLLTVALRSEPPTHFVALLTGESNQFGLPPLLFERQTIAPLETLDESGKAFRFADASAVQRSGHIAAIESKLREMQVQATDRIIVYVSAHGVSDDGEAFILAPSYDLSTPDQQRYRVRDLIAAMKGVDAATKVLVLDCSRLAALPRIGLAANEFVSLTEASAKEANDPNLWVMTAGAELEVSPLGLAEQRAVLGGAVVEALQGAADDPEHGGNADTSVSLEEFREFVQNRCAHSAVAAPVPRLIYCGPANAKERLAQQIVYRLPKAATKGEPQPAEPKTGKDPNTVSALSAAPRLTFVAAVQPGDEKAESPAATDVDKATDAAKTPKDEAAASAPEAAADAQPGAAEPGATSPGGTPEEGAEGKPSPSTPASPSTGKPDTSETAEPPSQPVERPLPPIVQCWQLRDQLRAGRSVNGLEVRPPDYAPHLARVLDERLILAHLQHLDSRGLARPSDSGAESLATGLRALLSEEPALNEHEAVIKLINSAREDYLESEEFKRLRSYSQEYVQAIVDFRRDLCEANDFVQWHGSLVTYAPDARMTENAARSIESLLTHLKEWDIALAKLQDASRRSTDAASRHLQEIDQSRREYDVEAARLRQAFVGGMQAAIKSPEPANQRVLESVLSTCLASSEQRRSALAALSKATLGRSSEASNPPSWKGVLDHLKLHIQLIKLVDPDFRDSPEISTFLKGSDLRSAPNADQRQMIRSAAKRVGAFYAELPRRAASAGENVDSLAVLLHPSDAVEPRNFLTAFIKPRLEPRPELRLTAPSPSPITLSEFQWKDLEWRLDAQNLRDSELVAVVEFDEAVVEVKYPGPDGSNATSGTARELARGEPMVFKVRARRSVNSGEARTTTMALTVIESTNSVTEKSNLQLLLPRPDRITLTARSVAPRRPQLPRGAAGIRLEPYPNRTTAFEFDLANQSDEAKELVVELFAIPPQLGGAGQGWPAGRLLRIDTPPRVLQDWAEDGMPGATPIAKASAALEPDKPPIRLKFEPPAPAAPAAAEGSAAPAAAAANPPAQPDPVASIDISQGVVCRISEKDRGDASATLVWLEVVPLRPTTYLTSRASIDGQVIRIASSLDRGDDGQPALPPGIDDQPVAISAVDNDRRFPSVASVPALIDRRGAEAILPVRPGDDHTRAGVFAIDVDGYPRAMRWRVDFDDQTIRPADEPEIHFERIAMKGADEKQSQIYTIWPFTLRIAEEGQLPGVVKEAVKVCAFDVSRGVNDLEVRLRADAPLVAFNTLDAGDVVTLQWADEEDAIVRYDDRDVRSEVAEITAAGELAVKTTATDYELKLRPPPGSNSRALKLTARLSAAGVSQADDLWVILDYDPPQLRALEGPLNVDEGAEKVSLSLEVADISGVSKIEAWFHEQPPQDAAELDPKMAYVKNLTETESSFNHMHQPQVVTMDIGAPRKDSYISLRATDRSGQATPRLGAIKVSVRKRPPPLVQPLVGDLRGAVMIGTRPARSGLEVFIKELPSYTTKTDASGGFVFRNLKADAYTIVVSGRAGSGAVSGEQEVKLVTKEDFNKRVTVKATSQLVPPPAPAPPAGP